MHHPNCCDDRYYYHSPFGEMMKLRQRTINDLPKIIQLVSSSAKIQKTEAAQLWAHALNHFSVQFNRMITILTSLEWDKVTHAWHILNTYKLSKIALLLSSAFLWFRMPQWASNTI